MLQQSFFVPRRIIKPRKSCLKPQTNATIPTRPATAPHLILEGSSSSNSPFQSRSSTPLSMSFQPFPTTSSPIPEQSQTLRRLCFAKELPFKRASFCKQRAQLVPLFVDRTSSPTQSPPPSPASITTPTWRESPNMTIVSVKLPTLISLK
ncbi:hypothetical protein RCL1_005833 [Eukaryota sp. TZLM3-RCL]